MSDEEYEYDYGSDADGDYEYDQQDENEDNNVVIEIENSFYEGDDIKIENPGRAIELFQRVIQLETDLGQDVKWRFKALQNLVVIYFSQQEYNKMISSYRDMLQYLSSVTRNECTDAINCILDTIASRETNAQSLSEMYEITLLALKTAKNERLWQLTNLKLAKLYLESHRLEELESLITVLKQSCLRPDGSEDTGKSAGLLEVYCLEIQLCSLTHDIARMQSIYPKTVASTAVADPRIMGIIREEGGKMYMAENNWMEAYNEFYEAFRNYQEAGHVRTKDCLKYVVLSSILSLSDINPFAAREAKAFIDDPEIVAMSNLRQSLENNDLVCFEKTVNNPANHILDEPMIMTYLAPLRRRIREQVLLNLIRPYDRVSLQFLGEELSLPVPEVELLLVDLIVLQGLRATIDKLNGVLLVADPSQSSIGRKQQSIEDVTKHYIDSLRKSTAEFASYSLL